MKTEDRLREVLRRGDGAGTQAPPDLWPVIERAVAHRRRRAAIGRVVAAAVVLLGSAALVWVGVAHHERTVIHPPPSPAPSPSTPASDRVVTTVTEWAGGDAVGLWKVYIRATNVSHNPLGAVATCMLQGASGAESEPGSARFQLIQPDETRSGMVTVSPFGAEPTGGACSTRAVPPVFPSPVPAVPPHFVPGNISFWDERRGLSLGQVEARPCQHACGPALAVTQDGGRTWEVVLRGRYETLHTLGPAEAWVGNGCGGATCLMHSIDGGRTWDPVPHERAIGAVQFLTSSVGWGVQWQPNSNQHVAWLMSTSDGGRSWTRRTPLCRDSWATTPISVWFTSTSDGWVTCQGESGSTDMWPKSIEKTTDGGATWSLVAGSVLGDVGTGLPELGNAGAIDRLQFVDQEHGWVSIRSGAPVATDDAGRTWRVMPGLHSGGADTTYFSWFVDPDAGYVTDSFGGRVILLRTGDGGATWQVVRRWRV